MHRRGREEADVVVVPRVEDPLRRVVALHVRPAEGGHELFGQGAAGVAQALLASYERKHKEVEEQSRRIVAAAKADAEAAAEEAKEALKGTIARRIAAAEDQIASAEAAAVKEVRDMAVSVAVAATSDVIAKNLAAKDASALIDSAIADVEAKLH